MLRKFDVNVNGKQYIVELEEITEGGAPVQAAPAPVSAPVVAPAPAPTAPAPAPAPVNVPSGGVTIDAPMPGNILSIKVKVGDKVAFEQPLVILEAMKMENELVSPKEGIVTAIHVAEHSAIDVGQPIITIG